MALFVVRHFSAMFILLAFSAPLLFCLANEEDSSQLGTRQDNSHSDAFSNDSEGISFFETLVKRLESESSSPRMKPETIAAIPEEELQEALRIGQNYVEKWDRLEEQIFKQNRTFSGYPRYMREAIAQSKEAAVYLMARKHLSQKLRVSPDKIGDIDRLLSVRQKPQSTSMPLCDFNSKFRSIDGTCNSKEQAQYGKAGTIFNRLLNSNQFYNDGVETIRKSQLTGSELPSARLVSATVLNSDDAFLIHPKATLLSIQWGQFLGHDLSHTPSFSQRDGSSYDCCSTTIEDGHPECLPIAIRSDDPIYSLLGSSRLTCMNFIRSAYGNNLDGTSPGMRSQINSVTHWIDASHVYGSTIEKANELRDTTSGRGRLKTSVDSNGRQMLPLGDFRVNQHPLLTLLHTVWLREHNRIAENLYRAAPGKADEFYYQHARRILIALMQHITYNEYLPVMIGPLTKLNVHFCFVLIIDNSFFKSKFSFLVVL
ncbi:chorion peroxidase-like isoform X2 [Daphnia pulex]|uniref:chorion peroxidase-like isoform X2 n=1 Tax=Daphnia pulex TaxID=6669 RepID=UPI001EE14CF3|nr:chorion peroxidase-like isoform X2 [Daphnia pulex]